MFSEISVERNSFCTHYSASSQKPSNAYSTQSQVKLWIQWFSLEDFFTQIYISVKIIWLHNFSYFITIIEIKHNFDRKSYYLDKF